MSSGSSHIVCVALEYFCMAEDFPDWMLTLFQFCLHYIVLVKLIIFIHWCLNDIFVNKGNTQTLPVLRSGREILWRNYLFGITVIQNNYFHQTLLFALLFQYLWSNLSCHIKWKRTMSKAHCTAFLLITQMHIVWHKLIGYCCRFLYQ